MSALLKPRYVAALLRSSLFLGSLLGVLWFLALIPLTEADEVFWTPDAYGGLIGAIPAVLIALVLETAFGVRRRMSLDTVVAALSLLVAELVALAAVTTCKNLTYVVGVVDGSGSVARPQLTEQTVGRCGEANSLLFTLPTIGLLVGFTAVIRLGVIAVWPTLVSSQHEPRRERRRT